jgi:hypothetical protein
MHSRSQETAAVREGGRAWRQSAVPLGSHQGSTDIPSPAPAPAARGGLSSVMDVGTITPAKRASQRLFTAKSPSDRRTAAKGPSDRRTAAKGPSDRRTAAKGPSNRRTAAKGPSDLNHAAKGRSDRRAAAKSRSDLPIGSAAKVVVGGGGGSIRPEENEEKLDLQINCDFSVVSGHQYLQQWPNHPSSGRWHPSSRGLPCASPQTWGQSPFWLIDLEFLRSDQVGLSKKRSF